MNVIKRRSFFRSVSQYVQLQKDHDVLQVHIVNKISLLVHVAQAHSWLTVTQNFNELLIVLLEPIKVG